MPLSNRLRKIKILDWLETKYYNITIGIRKIFEWLPIVWQDREWEYEYFTEKFIYHKLKNLQKRKYSEIFVEGWWMEKYINLCIKLMDEKRKMDKCDDVLWNSIEQPNHKFVPSDKEGYSTLEMTWSSPEAEEKYKKVILKELPKKEQKIHHLIYRILETRGQGWWD
jgi:hypothetical protein